MASQLNIFNKPAETRSYFQTTPLTPVEHLQAESGAKSQDDEILRFMTKRGGEWTAWALKDEFQTFEITSIRRALWNLENLGKIRQIGFVHGPKGRPVGRFIVA